MIVRPLYLWRYDSGKPCRCGKPLPSYAVARNTRPRLHLHRPAGFPARFRKYLGEDRTYLAPLWMRLFWAKRMGHRRVWFGRREGVG